MASSDRIPNNLTLEADMAHRIPGGRSTTAKGEHLRDASRLSSPFP